MAEDVNRHFAKKDIQVANGHMKMVFETISTGIGIFTSLIMGEMPIKITVRLILPHNCQNGYCPKAYNNKYWQGCGEKVTWVHCWW